MVPYLIIAVVICCLFWIFVYLQFLDGTLQEITTNSNSIHCIIRQQSQEDKRLVVIYPTTNYYKLKLNILPYPIAKSRRDWLLYTMKPLTDRAQNNSTPIWNESISFSSCHAVFKISIRRL